MSLLATVFRPPAELKNNDLLGSPLLGNLRNYLSPGDEGGTHLGFFSIEEKKHPLSIGTSLDGPESVNDAQRGQGYFQHTLAGIERARAHGLDVGCICTFTARSVPQAGTFSISLCARG